MWASGQVMRIAASGERSDIAEVRALAYVPLHLSKTALCIMKGWLV